jgi:hypothetical protein
MSRLALDLEAWWQRSQAGVTVADTGNKVNSLARTIGAKAAGSAGDSALPGLSAPHGAAGERASVELAGVRAGHAGACAARVIAKKEDPSTHVRVHRCAAQLPSGVSGSVRAV